MTKKIHRIPKFKSIEEEAEFWDTHSITDFPLDTKRVKVIFNLKEKKDSLLTIRLQPDIKVSLDKMAEEFGVNSSTLARMWLIEKLREIMGANK